MAIEHGQDNLIEGNIFRRENMALRIWANESQDPNWGYPKNRDTKSRDLTIKDNIFINTVGTVFNFRRTTGVEILNNFVKNNGKIFDLDATVKAVTFAGNELWITPGQEFKSAGVSVGENKVGEGDGNVPRPATMQPSGNVILGLDPVNADYMKRFSQMEWSGMAPLEKSSKSFEDMSPEELRQTAAYPYMVKTLAGGKDPFLKAGTLRGRRFILVDEWGPYDFKSPRMVLRSKQDGKMRFEILGPVGKWTVDLVSSNVQLSSQSGEVPGYVEVTQTGGSNFKVGLKYVGGETTDYRGIVTPAGGTVKFGFEQFRIPIEWEIRFWNYDLDSQDPRTKYESFSAVLNTEPAARLKTDELSGSWGGSPTAGVNSDYFATIAEGKFSVEPGRYVIDLTSDDGVRVTLDGKVIHDDWTYHAPKSEQLKVRLGGEHTLKIEHFELNGYSTLQVKIRPDK